MLAKPLLFFSSYAPLFAILALRFSPRWLVWSCVALAIAGVLALSVLLLAQRSVGAGTHKIERVEEAGQEAAAYLAAYLLPFVTISAPGFRDLAAYGTFLVVAAAIHMHSPVVQINPLLYVMGYRVLRVTDSHDASFYLVCRSSVVKGDRIKASLWDADVKVHVRAQPPHNSPERH
jgi:hypothetical protein